MNETAPSRRRAGPGAITPESLELAVGAALLASLVVLGLKAAHGSYISYESGIYLHNLLGPRPLFAKLFDPAANDLMAGDHLVGYRARELSYFFNWLDAQAIRLGARLGYPHFFSSTYVAGIALIAACNVVCARRLFGKGVTRVAYLLSALFLTSPAIALSSNYYRTSKILAGASAFFLLWRISALVSAPHESPPRTRLARIAAAAAALGLVMSLSDEQGVFLLALCLGFSIVACLARPPGRRAESSRVVAGLLGACAFFIFYSAFLGPKLVESAGNAAIPSQWRLADIGAALMDGTRLKAAWGLIMDTLGFQFGSLDFLVHFAGAARSSAHYPFSSLVAAFLFSGLALPALKARANAREKVTAALPMIGGLIACAALVAVFAVMVYRHPPILWEDVRRVYYVVPLSALILIASTFAAVYWSRVVGLRALEAALFGLLLLNLRQLPLHRLISQLGVARPYVGESGALQECLRRPDAPLADFRLSKAGRLCCEDYRESQRLRRATSRS